MSLKPLPRKPVSRPRAAVEPALEPPVAPPAPAATPRGEAMYALVRELYPICRSITGDGVRQTLEILGRHVPLSLTELPTGADVLDWTVPKEWNIKGGWI